MQQVDKESAIALYESGWWKNLSNESIVKFQLFQSLLCIPFGEFHRAVESVLGRNVWTHEFADIVSIRREFLGEKATPTMDEIMALLPQDKLIVFTVDMVEEQ